MKVFKSVLLAGVMALPLAVAAKATDMTPSVPSDVATTSGVYFRADAGASFLRWSGPQNDTQWVGDFGIGYQFNDNFRADLMGVWSGNYTVAPGATLGTRMVLGNVYYDWKNDSPITPYLGVGAGYGWIDTVGATTVGGTNGVAVNLTAGVSFDMTNNLALDVAYRFHDILVNANAPSEHQVTAGIRFKF